MQQCKTFNSMFHKIWSGEWQSGSGEWQSGCFLRRGRWGRRAWCRSGSLGHHCPSCTWQQIADLGRHLCSTCRICFILCIKLGTVCIHPWTPAFEQEECSRLLAGTSDVYCLQFISVNFTLDCQQYTAAVERHCYCQKLPLAQFPGLLCHQDRGGQRL